MGLDRDNIYNFAATVQCCLGEKAITLLNKLSLGMDCLSDKKDFIMATIYNILIRYYNLGGLSYIAYIASTSTTIYEWEIEDLLEINDVTVVPHDLVFNGTEAGFYSVIAQEINDYSDTSGFTAVFENNILYIYAPNGEDYNSVAVTLAADVQITRTLGLSETVYTFASRTFSVASNGYDCLTEEQVCNMVRYLNNYCESSSRSIGGCCS